MGRIVRGMLAAAIIVIIAGWPLLLYRAQYAHGKRLRVVTPGRVYRSGQMTEAGFADAIRTYKIRTIINLQDDYPDPDIQRIWPLRDCVKETALCQQFGVRYEFIGPDLLPRHQIPARRPEAIERFLRLMDNSDIYPVLIHCKAGLHRTGCLVAVYRMEYEGATPRQALREILANGFGRTAGTEANDYIKQYVLTYRPGLRQPEAHVQR